MTTRTALRAYHHIAHPHRPAHRVGTVKERRPNGHIEMVAETVIMTVAGSVFESFTMTIRRRLGGACGQSALSQ